MTVLDEITTAQTRESYSPDDLFRPASATSQAATGRGPVLDKLLAGGGGKYNPQNLFQPRSANPMDDIADDDALWKTPAATGIAESFLPQAITDVPSEIGKSLSENVSGAIHGLDPRGRAERGALQGTLDVGKGLLSAASVVPGAVLAPFRSLIGHPMADLEHKVGEYIAPEIAAKDDPREMYEKAASDVDTALAAMRPDAPKFTLRGAKLQKSQPLPPMGTDEIYGAADNLYTNARQSGVMLKPEAVNSKVLDIKGELRSEGLFPYQENAPGVHGLLDGLIENPEMLNRSGMHDIGSIHAAMKSLRNVARRSQNGNEREAAGIALDHLRDFLGDLPKNPGDIAYGAPNAGQAVGDLQEATRLWAIAKRADTIEEAVRNAYTGAGTTGSGANVENKLRQAVAAILKSKTKRRGFTEEEIGKMELIARGDYKGNVLRLLGKMAPSGIISGVGGLELARLLGARGLKQFAPAVAGHFARKAAEGRVAGQLENLVESIQGRATPGVTVNAPPEAPRFFNRGYLGPRARFMGAPLLLDQRQQQPQYASGGGVASPIPATPNIVSGGLLHSDVPGRTDDLSISVPSGAYVIPADIVAGEGQGNTIAGSKKIHSMFSGPMGLTPLKRRRGSMIGHASRIGTTRLPKGAKINATRQPFAAGGPAAPVIPVLPITPQTQQRLQRRWQNADSDDELRRVIKDAARYGIDLGPYTGGYATGGSPDDMNEGEPTPILAAGGKYIVAPEVVRQLGRGDLEQGHRVLDAFVLHAREQHVKQIKALKPPVKS